MVPEVYQLLAFPITSVERFGPSTNAHLEEMELELSQPQGPDGRWAGVKGKRKHRKRDEPGWAKGLRQLYNSVVEEPLPDSFKTLLNKLEEDEDG